MIIEYRYTDRTHVECKSRVLRTYKDVNTVKQNINVTYLYGLVPAKADLSNLGYYTEYAKSFLIAAIRLAPGEYLEVVDVPRD
jgi:hypothetical protein